MSTQSLRQRDEGDALVPDKEERKRNRRRRIEARQQQQNSASEQQTEQQQNGQMTGQRQLLESMAVVDKAKRDGIRFVTDVRVAADASEAARRLQEEQRRQERLAKLQDEVASTSRQTAAIETRWNQLLQLEIPQQLAQEIAAQNELCSEILASKDRLVSEFHRQLRQKDESYIKSLKEQAEAIDEVLSRMRTEFHELRLQYESETQQVEQAFAEERQQLIRLHNEEIDALFDRRRANEANYKQAKQQREAAYQRELEALIVQGSEQQNQLKIELETNIQMLKQQLADIRATYQLNAEKLDYNYNVLTELEKEKDTELTRYKRRLVKLKDQLSHHMAKYHEMENVDAKKNDELTEDYRRLTHKYKDLQSKFRHFETTDSEKYNEVWQMHEDECKDMIDRLLKADCVIGEQILGWKWVAPDFDSLSKLMTRTNGVVPAAMTRTASEDSAAIFQPLHIDTVSGIRIRAMLKMLASEAGFLLQPQIYEMIQSMPTNEAEVSRAEALLRALGIRNDKQLKELSAYFFRDTPQGKEVAAPIDEEEEEEDESMAHLKLSMEGEEAPEVLAELKHMIAPDDFLRAVEAYLRDQEEANGTTASSLAAKMRQDDQEAALRRASKRTAAYWDALADVVNADSVMVWKQLRKDLEQHIQMLSRRSQLVAEVQDLAQQNVNLKEQLRTYLTDPRNQEYQVPPTYTIQVRPLDRTTPAPQTMRTTVSNSPLKQRSRYGR